MADTRAFEKMEREGWASPTIAKGYAEGFHHATQQVAERLAAAVTAGPQKTVLDLCTGHGVVAAALAKHGAVVTGLDFSDAMIELARHRVPDVDFVQGDAMDLEFAAECFEAVTIGFGVPHFPDPARGLTEAARVLKPQGRIAFSIWQGKGARGGFGWLFEAFDRLGSAEFSLPEGPDAHQFTDEAFARSVLIDAGFHNVTLENVRSQIWLPTADGLFDVFDQGAVRAASLLQGQPADCRAAIRDALTQRVQREAVPSDGGFLIPTPSVILSATRT